VAQLPRASGGSCEARLTGRCSGRASPAADRHALGHPKGKRVNATSSTADTPEPSETVSASLNLPPLLNAQPRRNTNRCSGSSYYSFRRYVLSSALWRFGFNAVGYPRPNCLIAADRGPRERGPRPLNSHR